MNMLNPFEYAFIIRGLEAGIIIAIVAPLIGIFLVLRRYSLIADSLAHISLSGVAIAALSGINPIIGSILFTVVSSIYIEKLRTGRRVFGESALSIFLSGSLAFAVILIGLARGFNINIFNYLFGSIVTVTQEDIYVIFLVAILVITAVIRNYKSLIYITFDEESARVSGIDSNRLNLLLVFLAALTVSLSIQIIGILLISALIVIPVVSALQFKKSFFHIAVIAEIISVLSVIIGIFSSFYLNLPTGATIVLVSILFFIFSLISNKK